MAEKLDATFFAFRKRENGGVLLGASIAFAIGIFLLLVAFGGLVWMLLGGGDFAAWYAEAAGAAASGKTDTPPPPNMSGIFLIIPLEFAWLFLVFVLLASYESACIRWMVRGEKSGVLNLHFGADMWRVYGTYWVWFLFAVLGFVGFFIWIFITGFISASLGEAGGIAAFFMSVVYLLAWLYAAVRLAPAAATSIGIGEFAPQKAWSVTSDRFWALFGSYLLIVIINLVVFIVLGSIFMGAFYAQLFSGLDWSVAQSDPQAFARSYEQASLQMMQNMFSNPATIALYVGGQFVMYASALVFYVLFYGVASRAVLAALEEGKITPATPI